MSEYDRPEIPDTFQCSGCWEGVYVTDGSDGLAVDDPESVHVDDGDAECPNCGEGFADGWAGALGEKVAHIQLTAAAGSEDTGALYVGVTGNQPGGAFGYERDGDHVSLYKKRIPTEG